MMSGRQSVDTWEAVPDRCNLHADQPKSIKQQAVLTLPFEHSGLQSLDKIFKILHQAHTMHVTKSPRPYPSVLFMHTVNDQKLGSRLGQRPFVV